MKTLKFLIPITLIVFLSYCDDDFSPAPKEPDKVLLLELVNEYRTSGCNCGDDYFPPTTAVSWNDTLEAAAKAHSLDMDENDFFDHTGSNGSSAGDRISAQSYQWNTYGENIAQGYTSEQDVIDGWIKSEGHCRNIMNPNFKQMGVATSGSFWTQVFASH